MNGLSRKLLTNWKLLRLHHVIGSPYATIPFLLKIKKVINLRFITIFLLLSTFLSSLGDESKPIVLSKENLTWLKNGAEAKSIQMAFSEATKVKKECPKCQEFFPGANKYLSLVRRPFLLVEKEPTDFGGYFVLIVFKNHRRVYRFWVYEIEKSLLQVREIVPWGVRLNKRMLDEFTDHAYDPFWVAAK